MLSDSYIKEKASLLFLKIVNYYLWVLDCDHNYVTFYKHPSMNQKIIVVLSEKLVVKPIFLQVLLHYKTPF